MTATERLYEAAVRMARPLVRAIGSRHEKVTRGMLGRRDAVQRLESWAAARRDLARPLVWLHAPSVGESLMAQAIAGALRGARPDVQLAFTYFSPSAERVANRVGADVTGYLPWDLTGDMARALSALRPTIIAFVRTEIWPVLTREAQYRGVRLALVNAVLAEGSSRLRQPAKVLLRAAYARLNRVGAVAEADAQRLVRLGVAQDRIRITGDARFDQVWQRVQQLDRGSPLLHVVRREVPLLVAGSTWPPDEDRLVASFMELHERLQLRLLIAPHEPTPEHLGRLEAKLSQAGLRHERLSAAEQRGSASAMVTIVDRVGVLADLYAIAAVAYVGGGFGKEGLHSVIEPAALGVPVICGPRHGNAGEAMELAIAGGAFIVNDTSSLTESLERLLSERGSRPAAGQAASRFVSSRLGAARRNAEVLLELIEHSEHMRRLTALDAPE